MTINSIVAQKAVIFVQEMMDGKDLDMVVRKDNGELEYQTGKWGIDLRFDLIKGDDIDLTCPNDDYEIWDFLMENWERDLEEFQVWFLKYERRDQGCTKYAAIPIQTED